MAQKKVAWNTGDGFITFDYTGQRNGTIRVSSDPNNLYERRRQTFRVITVDGTVIRTIEVIQEPKSPKWILYGGSWSDDGIWRDEEAWKDTSTD